MSGCKYAEDCFISILGIIYDNKLSYPLHGGKQSNSGIKSVSKWNGETKENDAAPAVFSKLPLQRNIVVAPYYNFTRRKTPLKHIAFIKTHKCASSTIQNILMRYGIRNHLTFVLPKNIYNMAGWPHPFDPSKHMRPIKEEKADILCFHSVFSEKIAEVMKKDTFYLTIVREPLSMMQSFYSYENWNLCYKKTLREIIAGFPHQTVICKVNAYNPMMFDMGFPVKKHSSSLKAIDEYIGMLDKRFNLVMIVEYFEESLIILRDMLGWSNEDILSFAVNFRKSTNGSFENVAMEGVDMSDDEESKAFLYEKSIADAKLYYHFKSKLEATIEANRTYFTKEKLNFQAVKQRWMEFCIKSTMPNDSVRDKRFKGFGNFVYGYALSEEGLKNQTCIDLATPEPSFVERVNKYQSFGLRRGMI